MNLASTETRWPFASRTPTAEEMHLVRLCMTSDPEEAERSWGRLAVTKGRIAGHAELRSPLRRLLPLLRHALKLWGLPHAPDIEAALTAATLWEMQRAQRIEQVICEVLDLLQHVDAHPVLLKGVALGWRDYPKPWLRHCHDLDLLLPLETHDAAEALLMAKGARRVAAVAEMPMTRMMLWPGGLPILMHARMCGGDRGAASATVAGGRATEALLGGRSVRILHPVDCALQLASQLAEGTARDGLGWVADLGMLLRSVNASSLRAEAGAPAAPALGSMLEFAGQVLAMDLPAERRA